MNIGLDLKNFTWPGGVPKLGETLASIARRAEDAGFHSIWTMDHYFQLADFGPAESYMPECYSMLHYMAAVTNRVKLGVMVVGITYRHPAYLVKIATTLDVLSGGRTYFGLGAAWYEREHVGLDFPFPPLGERFRRLEETLQIAKQMWSGQVKPFEGRYYQLKEPICSPPPLQKPHPPILVGGGGEQKTLRLVAKYANACNTGFGNPDTMRQKLQVLREHCKNEGTDYDAIEKTTNVRITLDRTHSKDQALERLRDLAGAGCQLANVMIADMHEPGVLERWGKDIIPEVASASRSRRPSA